MSAIDGSYPVQRPPRLDLEAPMVDNIARLIGAGLAARICERFGGRRIYIASNPAPDAPLPSTIGYAAALRVGSVFGGERVAIPREAGHQTRSRVAALRREGLSVSKIAHELGCSERNVYKVLAQLRKWLAAVHPEKPATVGSSQLKKRARSQGPAQQRCPQGSARPQKSCGG